MLFDPSEKYPKYMFQHDKKLKSKEINFEILNETSNICHETIINGDWDKKHVIIYFTVNCASNKGELMLITHRNRHKKLKEQRENRKRKLPSIEQNDYIKYT